MRFIVSLLLTLPILAFSQAFLGFFGIEQLFFIQPNALVLWGLASIVFFYGGWPFLKGAWKELKEKNPGMMTLIGLAISVAYIYSSAVAFGLEGKLFFWELATLVVVMLLGHWIEMRSVMSASGALQELAKLIPSEAHLITESETKDVSVKKLDVGDKILIKPGEKIPADGEIYEGSSSVNEAMVTGESKPVLKEKEDEVIGGTVNGDGSLKIKIEKTGEESFLSQMIQMVKEAQEGQSKTQNLADKAARWLTVIAITAGFLTLFAWLVFAQSSFVFSLERMVTVMVITCPHALGLAIPLVVAISTTLGAKNGLLIRNRDQFENARNLDAIVFDKTGTLTKGEFGVTKVSSFKNSYDKQTILKYAGSIDAHSDHPIGRAIAAEVEEEVEISNFEYLPGKGVQAQIEGKDFKVVGANYLSENNISIDQEKIKNFPKQATQSYLLVEEEPVGAIALTDTIRPEAKEAIEILKKRDIKPIMLTGDKKEVAKAVADELGIEEYFAEVLPDQKVEKIKEIQSRNVEIAMVGDGINDAPSLAQADVGIAIGSGTDVAFETADIILVKNNPLDVADLIKLSQKTHRKMIQNLAWATGYNVFAIPLAAGVLAGQGIILSPAVGALIMSLSTVIVAINAKLLR